MNQDFQQWYALETERIPAESGTDIEHGLTAEEAARRLAQYGKNAVTVIKGQSAFLRFLLQFNQPLVYVLLISAGATLLLGEFADSAVIFGVVLVNAIIGFVQEDKAIQAIGELSHTLTAEATVIRDGERRHIPAEVVVPGDVVLLFSGDKVPADMRLIHTRDLQAAESALTGESVPVLKSPAPLEPDTSLADRTNMVYASTLITYGSGTGIVTATGNATEVGKISRLLAETISLETPLTRKIATVSGWLLYAIMGLAAACFLVGVFIYDEKPVAMLLASIALAVGAIPEGLPAAVTITLAIGVGRMAKRGVIIRKLPAVETLGSTTVICSDKTGTLTENQMTVTAIITAASEHRVGGAGYVPKGDITEAERGGIALEECLLAGLLCNEARHIHHNGQWLVEGDPTEGALIVAAKKFGLTEAVWEERQPRLDAIPFESEYQYMATLHAAETATVGYIKGSVESVLPRCENVKMPDGGTGDVDSRAILAAMASQAGEGCRVLAFAIRRFPEGKTDLSHEDLAQGLTFLGLQAMIDPPRTEAVVAVEECKLAGIRVVMITGDHALTAGAIAHQLGILTSGASGITIGRELSAMNEEAFAKAAATCNVFARVAPEQKLRLVQALQRQGNVVAMTGDGVNDAPALKQADIGVAMGITGSEASKEAADMVLTDDNFASIVAAVQEGRAVFDNLLKFLVWTLPTNMGIGLVILAAVVTDSTLPILPLQTLWINMTTAVLLGLMLAFEPKEAGLMTRQPRLPSEPMFRPAYLQRIVLVATMLVISSFALFEIALSHGHSPEYARTIAVNVFVFGETFFLFNCRSLTNSMFSVGVFSNRWVLGGVTIMTALQVLFVYAPPMQAIFKTTPLDLQDWGYVLLSSLAIYTLIGVEKWLRKR